jgi:hypothetical protein
MYVDTIRCSSSLLLETPSSSVEETKATEASREMCNCSSSWLSRPCCLTVSCKVAYRMLIVFLMVRAEAALGKSLTAPYVSPPYDIHVGSSNDWKYDLHGCFSPHPRPCPSPQPIVLSASKSKGISGVMTSVFQIMPELYAICGGAHSSEGGLDWDLCGGLFIPTTTLAGTYPVA